MSSRSIRLRLAPAPQADPPFDDEGRSAPHELRDRGVHGALALSAPAPTGPPRPDLRVVHPDRSARGRSATRLGRPARWAGGFVQAVIEVLCGRRPVQQLLRWTSLEVYEQLQRRARRPWQVTQVPSPRSVHWSEPRDGVAEVSCVVQVGVRHHAVALRLEEDGGRWRCTALELGPMNP